MASVLRALFTPLSGPSVVNKRSTTQGELRPAASVQVAFWKFTSRRFVPVLFFSFQVSRVTVRPTLSFLYMSRNSGTVFSEISWGHSIKSLMRTSLVIIKQVLKELSFELFSGIESSFTTKVIF
jgi:hypothetical protein